MKRLSRIQRQTYAALKAWNDEHGYPPTYRQLARVLDLKSTQTVWRRVKSLKEAGVIEMNAGEPRTLRIIACPLDPSTGEVA